MTVAYGTILDSAYLPQGLALYRSWRAAVRSGSFYFFTMDDRAARTLEGLSLEGARVVPSADITRDALEMQRGWRTMGEICWANKPLAIRAMLDDRPDTDWACYLDGDMAMFADPEPVLHAVDAATFGLFTPHRFGPSMTHWIEKVGVHNAGFAAFRRSPDSHRVLERWFADCLARPSLKDRRGDTFDQKILDHIVAEEPGIADLDHPGVNLAPWNADNYTIAEADGQVLVDDQPLLIYHYQSLRMHGRRLYTLYNGDWNIPAALRRLVYLPYVRQLRVAMESLRAVDPGFQPRTHPLAVGWKQYLVLGTLLARRRRHLALA